MVMVVDFDFGFGASRSGGFGDHGDGEIIMAGRLFIWRRNLPRGGQIFHVAVHSIPRGRRGGKIFHVAG